MPINSITQTISTIPEAGHRGVDVQTQFVIKQEDFQDHLTDTTVTELNTLKDQFNSRISEINSTATTMNGYANTASAGASTATTKAGEASTSAGEALSYRNQAETFKNNASTSATKASQWADNNYNVEVETGKYSAKHWSTVAQNATANKVDKVTSTDNAIVRFDGVTGQVQNSSIIIDDAGNISASGTIRTDLPGYGTSFISSGTGSNFQIAHNINGYSTILNSGGGITIETAGAERVRIDTSGNLGLGTTPSNWSSTMKSIDILNNSFLSTSSGIHMTKNAYYNNGWKYKTTDYAGDLLLDYDGSLAYRTATSGTAGGTVSWNEKLKVTNAGNLLLGTNIDNGVDKLQVEGSISASNVYNETSIIVLIPAGATVTQEFSLPLIYTTYAVKATMDGNNMVLHAFANYHTANWAAVIVGISNKFIGDYNVGSIDLQTKNNLPQFTYGPEKGLKGQCVVTNGDSVARNLVITIKKII